MAILPSSKSVDANHEPRFELFFVYNPVDEGLNLFCIPPT